MAHLAMFVSRLPGLRVTELTREHAPALSGLITEMEVRFFGRSQTNLTEIRAVLHAPELHGTRGTAGVWDGPELVGALLVYDELTFEAAVSWDLFVGEHPDRSWVIDRLLHAVGDYASALPSAPATWLKGESFAGDKDVIAALTAHDYQRHRVYLRMRIDAAADMSPVQPPRGLRAEEMTEARWPDVHQMLMSAFADHYDFHPVPLPEFRRQLDRESIDLTQWRLVFDGADLVGVRLSSNRYAEHRLGYVDTLGVVREHRGRGIATYLLQDAFVADRAAGFTGTALHCDATSPTGATRLYRAVGMQPDQRYDAWRRRRGGRL